MRQPYEIVREKFVSPELCPPLTRERACSGNETASTVANRSILPHSDWLASADRSKPIIMPYLPIFATVSFNVTVAKICKYSAMIGLLRLDHVNRSKPIKLRQMLRFTTAHCYFRTM